MSDQTDDDGPTNDELLEALVAVDEDATSDARSRMFTALLDATLVVPVTNAGEAVRAGAQDLDLDVPVLTTADGRTALPVFTDEDALSRFDDEDTAYVGIVARTLFRMLAAEPPDLLVLNPAGPVGLELERDELAVLAEGRVPPPSSDDGLAPEDDGPAPEAQLRIGVPQPEDVPVGLVPAARDALAADPELVEGYLVTVATEDGDGSQLALGIVFAGDPDEDAIRTAFTTVGEAIREHVGDGGLGMFPLGEELRQRLQEGVDPLYVAG